MDRCKYYTEDVFPALRRRIGNCQQLGKSYKCVCDGDPDKCHIPVIQGIKPKENRIITYSDVFEQFKSCNIVPNDMICDYRPCTRPYVNKNLSNAIIVYLRNDSSIIYIYDERLNKGETK